MIAVDTNILVYAHRSDSPWHEVATERLRALAEGPSRWAIPWPCIHEFLAIVTHRHIYSPPSTIQQAIDQVDAWLESPTVNLIGESSEHWALFRHSSLEGRLSGPVMHDARVAVICLGHGVSTLWSADRDFNRFPALSTLNPLIQAT